MPKRQKKQADSTPAYSWLPRAKGILQSLTTYPQLLSRFEVEMAFGIQKHAAIRLMRKFGAQTHAGAFFLPRSAAIAGVRAVAAGGEFDRTERRMARIAAILEDSAKTHTARNTI